MALKITAAAAHPAAILFRSFPAASHACTGVMPVFGSATCAEILSMPSGGGGAANHQYQADRSPAMRANVANVTTHGL
jgi:hypothetical protein